MTSRVEHLQRAARGLVLHRRRHAVGREHHGGAVRHLVQLFDEHRAQPAQPLDHVAVMHHLVPHVDRRAEQLQRTLDDIDGAVDAGAEPTGIGENDFHMRILQASILSSLWGLSGIEPRIE